MATLFNPFFQAIDGNGVPISGALLNFYQTGTSSRQNTFTDSTLATPNTNPVPADSTGRFPPIYLGAAFDYKAILTDSLGVTLPNGTRDPIGYVPSMSLGVIPSYLRGLTLSAAGGNGTFGVAAGTAADSTNLAMMNLSGALTKTTAAWAAGTGAGSLDTGSIAASTWYHAHQIQNPSTGIVDVLTSLSPVSPTLPSGYTLFRRIGSPLLTDGSKHWIAFVQDGDLVQWAAPVQDIAATNPGTSAVLRTLGSVPTGINVLANIQAIINNASNGGIPYLYLSDPATNDILPTNGFTDVGPAGTAATGAILNAPFRGYVRTNTSAQIRSRLAYSDASCSLIINTLGWIDRRGRDA